MNPKNLIIVNNEHIYTEYYNILNIRVLQNLVTIDKIKLFDQKTKNFGMFQFN